MWDEEEIWPNMIDLYEVETLQYEAENLDVEFEESFFDGFIQMLEEDDCFDDKSEYVQEEMEL